MRDSELLAQLAKADRLGLTLNLVGTGILTLVALFVVHSVLAAFAVLAAGLVWTLLTHGFALILARLLE